jgi:patatin-like phospholipase/acyl hydrolase
MKPDRIVAMYEKQGPNIFKPSTWRQILGFFNLAESKYDNVNLKKALLGVFGDSKLGDLETRVVIPTFNLDNGRPNTRQRTWSPKIFHNFPGADSDEKMKARDVALYTSSAPTYFPTEKGYIDGGVFANNPAKCAYVAARRL